MIDCESKHSKVGRLGRQKQNNRLSKREGGNSMTELSRCNKHDGGMEIA